MQIANLFKSLILTCLVAEGKSQLSSCGFPGQPKNGNVTIVYDASHHSLQQIAKYECPGSYIAAGNAERNCQYGKWTGTLPRCAVEVSPVTTKGQNIGRWRSLTDKNLESCEWLRENSSLWFRFQKNHNISRVTVISPISRKASFQKSEWQVDVMEEEFGTVNTAKNGMFQERELIFADDQFSSIRWSLDKYGDTAQVTLQRGEAYVCEVLVHAFPDGCGLAEQPANGYIDYEGTSRAVCRCHFGYKPSPAGVRDCLLWGQWEGEQCTCHTSSSTNLVLVTFISTFGAFMLISLCIFGYFAYRNTRSTDTDFTKFPSILYTYTRSMFTLREHVKNENQATNPKINDTAEQVESEASITASPKECGAPDGNAECKQSAV